MGESGHLQSPSEMPSKSHRISRRELNGKTEVLAEDLLRRILSAVEDPL